MSKTSQHQRTRPARAAAQFLSNWVCLLLWLPALVGAAESLPSVENGAATAPTTVVWRLDNVLSIGGHKPQVLGAPKVVREAAGGSALLFDGKRDGLVFPVNPLAGWIQFTIEVLFRPDADGPLAQRFLHLADDYDSRALLETRIINGKSWSLDTFLQSGKNQRALFDPKKLHPTGKWAWVALVYDGRKMTDYVNGVKELDGEVAFTPMMTGQLSVGVRLNHVYWFTGSIQELRFQPAALAPETLQRVSAK